MLLLRSNSTQGYYCAATVHSAFIMQKQHTALLVCSNSTQGYNCAATVHSAIIVQQQHKRY
jgi:hypothetical protein